MLQKKKVRLVDRVECENMEFRLRDAARRGEEDLPKRLLEQPPILRFRRRLGRPQLIFFIAAKPFQ